MFIGNRGSYSGTQGGQSLQRTTHLYPVRKLNICQVSLLPQHFRGCWFRNRHVFNGSRGSYCGIQGGRSLKSTTHLYSLQRLRTREDSLLPKHFVTHCGTFLFAAISTPTVVQQETHIQLESVVLLSGRRRTEPETDHSPLSSVELKHA
jgi:hypothetical protein